MLLRLLGNSLYGFKSLLVRQENKVYKGALTDWNKETSESIFFKANDVRKKLERIQALHQNEES